jgi:hypothetical protein
VKFTKGSQPKVFWRPLFRDADAGESAKQVQRSGICLTLFGQEANATHLVSKCIGNAETCSRANTRLREYAIAISTSPLFVVTLPMPLLGWAMRHLKSNVLIVDEPCPAVETRFSSVIAQQTYAHARQRYTIEITGLWRLRVLKGVLRVSSPVFCKVDFGCEASAAIVYGLRVIHQEQCRDEKIGVSSQDTRTASRLPMSRIVPVLPLPASSLIEPHC